MKLKIAVLGITGSVGSSLVKLLRENKDSIKLSAMSGWNNQQMILELAKEFSVEKVVVADEKKKQAVEAQLSGVKVLSGQAGLLELVDETNDILFILSSGSSGLMPLYKALSKGMTVGLANKESLVLGGELIKKKLDDKQGRIVPLDSEHNALYQCLVGRDVKEVEQLVLTASGGPFLDYPHNKFSEISLEQALRHPKWDMGHKVTIDSATMMNKCLEIIEARWLFGFDADKIKALVHPQSIVHGMVNFKDGSSLAMLGDADMRLPLANCLGERIKINCSVKKLSITDIAKLEFQEIDQKKFPTLSMAYKVLEYGGGASAFLNGANQQLTDLFLAKKVAFTDIFKYLRLSIEELEKYFNNHRSAPKEVIKLDKISDALLANESGKNFIKQQIENNK